MSHRQVSISLKQIKFFSGLFLFVVLAVSGFVFFEARDPAHALEGVVVVEREAPTATPFLPSSDADSLLFENTVEAVTSPTARPTVVFEDGIYPTAIPVALPTISNITPYSLPAGINPLTGRPPDSAEFLDRRPVASKITLYPRIARPEYGLTKADVVFEYYIEWGLTRFIAVFYGTTPNQIGPVRSGRFFDEHVVRMYQSYLVFKYADKRVLDYFKTSDIKEFLVLPLFSECSPFFIGEEDRELYNNVFFNYTRFGPCLDEKGFDNEAPNLRAGYFSSQPSYVGEPALRIHTTYSVDDYNYWEYDPLYKRYLRYQDADDTRDGKTPSYEPLIDKLTGEHVSADNVVVIFVPHSFADKWQKEDQVYHIEPLGTGRAYLFRDGIVMPAYWRRIAIDQPLEITDQNGTPLSRKPGRTFFQVLSEESRFSHEGSDWYFEFDPIWP